MAIRTLKYTVSPTGISPSRVLPCGIQGEHNATEIEFSLDGGLLLKIQHEAEEKTPIYRFDVYVADQKIISTEPKELKEDTLTLTLTNQMTKSALDLRVYLVISVMEEDKTALDMYSFPAVLSVTPVPDGDFTESEEYSGMTELFALSSEAAKRAEQASKTAYYSACRTESAKLSLENGAEFVFLGGDAKSALKMDLVIDDEINNNSQNPVQNSAILNYINSEIEKAKKDALLLSHPIGSYYFSDFDTDPALLFGGEWERVKDRFILAAGDIYEANTVGGSDKHSHSLNSGYALVSATGGLGDGINLKRIEVEEYDSIFYDAEFSDNAEQKTTYATALGGSSDTCSNMPPFVVVYCFKRIL